MVVVSGALVVFVGLVVFVDLMFLAVAVVVASIVVVLLLDGVGRLVVVVVVEVAELGATDVVVDVGAEDPPAMIAEYTASNAGLRVKSAQ